MDKKTLSNLYGLHMGVLMLGQFLIIPIMTPLFIHRGLNIQDIALVISTIGVTVIILELPTGGLADQVGRKKVFLFSMVMNILSMVTLFSFQSFWGYVTSMFFWGACIAFYSGTLKSWFVEKYNSLPGDLSLQEGFARVSVRSNGLGALGGLICAGVLGLSELSTVDIDTSFNSLIFLATFCYLVVFANTIIWIKEDKEYEKLNIKHLMNLPVQLGSGIACIQNPKLLKLLIAMILGVPISSGIENFWPVQFELVSGEIPVGWVYGILSAIVMFLGSLSAAVTSWLCHFLNQELGKVVFIGVAIKALMAILLSSSEYWLYFSMTYVAYFFSASIGLSALSQLQHQFIKDNVRSTVDSVISFSMRVGAIIGTLVCGFGASYLGINTIWVVSAFLAIFGGLLFLSKDYNQKREQLPELNKGYKQ